MQTKSKTGTAPEWRCFPHIIGQELAANVRHDLHITNEPLPEDRLHWHAAYAFWCDGAVDDADRVTAVGRAAIVDGLRAEMHPNNEMCVVWGPRSCTYVTRHGTIDSDDPPFGQPRDTAAITRLQAMDYEGAVLRLPTGCRCPHLFIRRLAHDRVEIASASRMTLYDTTESIRPGETDPVAGCTRYGDILVRPSRMMGVAVTGENDGVLLGPVQPDGEAFEVVPAWPSRVAEACIAIAGRPLDAKIVQAAWRAAEELPCPPINCGVRLVG